MDEDQVHLQQYSGKVEEHHTPKLKVASDKDVSKSDAAIWREFRNGNEEALVYIYREYANKMYNYGCQFTRNKELVSDSIQELFTEIIHNKKNLGDTVSIKFYLFKALRRKLLRVLRKEKKYLSRNETAEHEGFNILEDTSVKFIYQQFCDYQKAIITKECNKLPCKQREALLLYFYEGMSYKEIAETMGMTRTKSARAIIYRAIDSLSEHLQRYKEFLYPLWPFIFTCQFL